MTISDEQQDVIDSIVGTLKQAQNGDAETILRPHVDLIPDLCAQLVNENHELSRFAADIHGFISREAVKEFARTDGGPRVWNDLANSMQRYFE